MNDKRLMASISLDLDNLWSYLKIQGNLEWKTFPSYLDTFVPYILDLLDTLKLKITFFIVGQDAALVENRDALKEIVLRGHEIANHSFNHEPWLHLYSETEIKDEISQAEEAIYQATGQKPLGFRGPGFCWSPTLLKILSEKGYLYDSTLLPTFIGPLARMYYFKIAKVSQDEKKTRNGLFGSFKEGFSPLKPYFWELPKQQQLLELPVTTIPIVRTPFHMSYLMFLCRFSEPLMHSYLNTAIFSCKLTKTEPNFLLHPTDVIGADKAPEMAFFPGMSIETSRKKDIFLSVMGKFAKSFQLVNMSTRANHTVVQEQGIKRKKAE